jgi:adenosylhomocysteine nucleosidase
VILVFAAMQPEVGACLGWMRQYRQTEIEGFPALQADGAIICQTGLGRRARIAAEALIERFRPGAALSVGVAGGLVSRLEVGDVVMCQRIDHESHRAGGKQESVVSDSRLLGVALGAAKGLGLPVSKGTSLTVDVAAWGPAEKSAHHSWKGHDIVEMESFWIGEAAARHNVPFVAIRTISDCAGDELVQTYGVKEDGTFDTERFLEYAREHPESAPLLAAQAERSRVALGNLAIVLAGFLPPLVQHFHGGER